jgi:hypothetical protein
LEEDQQYVRSMFTKWESPPPSRASVRRSFGEFIKQKQGGEEYKGWDFFGILLQN